MFSVKRKIFASLFLLCLLAFFCLWYSESHISRLSIDRISIVTTVHSYVFAPDTRSRAHIKSNLKNNLNKLLQLKVNLESPLGQYSDSQLRHNESNIPTRSHTEAPLRRQVPFIPDPSFYRRNDGNNSSKYENKQPMIMTKSFTAPVLDIKKLHDGNTIATDLVYNNTSSGVVKDQFELSTHEPNVTHPNQTSDLELLTGKKSEMDSLVRSLLLEILMNQTSGNYKKPLTIPLKEPKLTIAKLGCKITGNFPSEESKRSWLNFNRTLEIYVDFHHRQLQQLRAGNSSVKTLTWSCYDPIKCAGIGDQLYRIQQVLVFAIAFNRVLCLHWNSASYETMKYLRPNKIDWTCFNGSLRMHEYSDKDINRIKVMDSAQEFELFYKLLASENHTHVTVNHELQVPFLRGMVKAIKTMPGMHKALQEIGFVALLTDKKQKIPVNFLSGELLRYLFHFKRSVVDGVDQVQKQLGLDAGNPYLAVHMRTGFLGMKQEESGHFNSDKIYRSPEDWERTLTCSVSLSNKLFGSKSVIFLATDSEKVKELAMEKYSERFVMINVTLQHVAFSDAKKTEPSDRMDYTRTRQSHHVTFPDLELMPNSGERIKPILNLEGVDGYMATWIEFLLLAQASSMVHSISGFSSTAAQYCSMHNQYHVPNCGKN